MLKLNRKLFVASHVRPCTQLSAEPTVKKTRRKKENGMVPNDVTPEEKFAAPKRRSYAERMLGFEDESDEATEPLGFVDDIPRAERLTEYKEEKKPRARKAQELDTDENGVAIWLTDKLPRGYFATKSNRKKYIEWLGGELNVKTLSDWYPIVPKLVCSYPQGDVIMKKYSLSMHKMMLELYPEYDWIPWNFDTSANKIWYQKENVHQFLTHIRQQLMINRAPEDWYRVSEKLFAELGGSGLMDRFGGIGYLLWFTYPNVNWKLHKFQLRKIQIIKTWIFDLSKTIFPQGTEIIQHYTTNCQDEDGSSHSLVFDFYIPAYNLLIDYHPVEHYHEEYSQFGGISAIGYYKLLEKEKARFCESRDARNCSEIKGDVCYTRIPYWWDLLPSSFLATLLARGLPIPDAHTKLPSGKEGAPIPDLPPPVKHHPNRIMRRPRTYASILDDMPIPLSDVKAKDCYVAQWYKRFRKTTDEERNYENCDETDDRATVLWS